MELSQAAFLALVACTAAARVAELLRSKANQRALLARGASLPADPGYRWMVLLHTSWLAAAVLEVTFAGRPFLPWLGFPALLCFLAANALRYWAIRSLATHWNTQVVDSTTLGTVAAGPYRWVRHPNYTAVFIELAALPLVHTAFLTAALATALHIPVLAARIRKEEEVLMASAEYRRLMGHKPRFLP
jgi:methyltransferase